MSSAFYQVNYTAAATTRHQITSQSISKLSICLNAIRGDQVHGCKEKVQHRGPICSQRESNPRPPVYQTGALLLSYGNYYRMREHHVHRSRHITYPWCGGWRMAGIEPALLVPQTNTLPTKLHPPRLWGSAWNEVAHGRDRTRDQTVMSRLLYH
jgi:hypothetical protein